MTLNPWHEKIEQSSGVHTSGGLRAERTHRDDADPCDGTAPHESDRVRGIIATVESGVYPVISVTLDGTITSWNAAAERLYGYAAAEVVGASINLIIPADRRDEFPMFIDWLRRGRPLVEFETVRVTKDAHKVDVRLSASAIRSSLAEPIEIVSITRDITEQRAAEEKFRLAVEACPNGMLMSDAAGNIVLVNGEIERMFGHRREELIGRPLEILLPERLRQLYARQHDAFGRESEPRRMVGCELVGLRQDGGEFPIEVSLNPIRTRDGVLVLSVMVDITERKRLDRLKEEFVSIVSHELRTPLTSIAGALGLLMGNAAGHLPETAVRLLKIAYTNGQRLVRLVNDILDLQKIEAGEVVYRLKCLDLRPLIEQTIDANRAFGDGFKVRIRLDERSVDGEALADPDRLAQVLTNLLSNAVKYSPADDEVVVAIERRDDHMRISVRDHGSGIPEEFKSRIFGRFAQVDSSDPRQKGGTGLGLSIVKQLVEQQGGKIGFEAAQGGGTIFYFELPASSSGRAGDDGVTQADIAKPSLLLCDGDTIASAALAEALRRAGFAIDAVSTATRANVLAIDASCAALLIDLQFLDLVGPGLIRQLRELPCHTNTPVILVSIDPAHTDGEPGFTALPVCGWLDKPSDREQLLRVIRQAVASINLTRPRILHLESDDELRRRMRDGLRSHAEVISAGSVDGARKALATLDFDLVVLDLAALGESDLDLLRHLYDHDGCAIPVLFFGADDAALTRRTTATLGTAHMSIDRMVRTLRRAIARQREPVRRTIEVA